MKRTNQKLTDKRIQELTSRNVYQATSLTKKVEAYNADRDKDKRVVRGECACCYYLNKGGLAGQAFTDWNCAVCDKEDTYPNTSVPMVCKDCSKKHNLCVECGGDIEMKKDRASIE